MGKLICLICIPSNFRISFFVGNFCWFSKHNITYLFFSAGFYFDVRFGFGLLNAGALVKMALNWMSVPSAYVCHVDAAPYVCFPSILVILTRSAPLRLNWFTAVPTKYYDDFSTLFETFCPVCDCDYICMYVVTICTNYQAPLLVISWVGRVEQQ